MIFIDYAVVLESPSHGPTGNPEFMIRVCRKSAGQWQNAPISEMGRDIEQIFEECVQITARVFFFFFLAIAAHIREGLLLSIDAVEKILYSIIPSSARRFIGRSTELCSRSDIMT